MRAARILVRMHAPEIELKFAVADIERFRARAQSLGLTLVTPRTFEANTLYDTPERDLRVRRQVLRLRDYAGRSVVTHKRVASDDADARYKIRIETESTIEDPAALAEIFAQLGYKPVFRYEKFRTEWEAGAGHIFLDETPIGVYAELEGPPAWIESMPRATGRETGSMHNRELRNALSGLESPHAQSGREPHIRRDSLTPGGCLSAAD